MINSVAVGDVVASRMGNRYKVIGFVGTTTGPAHVRLRQCRTRKIITRTMRGLNAHWLVVERKQKLP